MGYQEPEAVRMMLSWYPDNMQDDGRACMRWPGGDRPYPAYPYVALVPFVYQLKGFGDVAHPHPA